MTTTTTAATERLDCRVRLLREEGSRLTNSGKPAAGARKLRAALRILCWPAESFPGGEEVRRAHPVLTSHVLISLGLAEAEQGDTARGLATLEAAGLLVNDHDRPILLQQRGLVLHRAGRLDEALPLFDEAVPLLERAGEPFALTSALLNRVYLNLSLGKTRRAREDLNACRIIAAREGFVLTEAKVEHDAGYCAVLEGDIPAALRAFDNAGALYAEHGAGYLPVLRMDKARALLAAGLGREAGRELDAAFALFTSDRFSVDYAWAELTRAQTALACGDPATARNWAARAGRRFRRHGDHAWSAVADLTVVRARLALTSSPAALVPVAHRLADRLRALGLGHDADLADLLAARALFAAGRPDQAREIPALSRRAGPATPLDVRLLRRLLRAKAHTSSGPALRELRAGLDLLHAQRRRWASVELRAAVAGLGAELAGEGLGIALATASPRQVFAWTERCRAQAFLAQPVRAPADQEVREALAEIRQLSENERAAELRGRADALAQARVRRRRLEHLIRQRTWQQDGGGPSRRIVSLPAVQARLANRVLISLVDREGDLSALVVGERSVTLVPLGPTGVVTEAVHRLLSDLDALCGRVLPARLEAALTKSLNVELTTLSRAVAGPLRRLLGDRDAVIVPTGDLGLLPWGLLPEFRGRPVTVAPSASVWTFAQQTARPAIRGGALLVAGPRLPNAEAEVVGIHTVRPDARCLTGSAATVAAVLRALDGVDVAHLVAHGHHQPDNVLFSCLDLADGPLMAYDLTALAVAPRHVVLSACDVGRATVRAGDELLGFSAALLYAGTSTVVASLARVPDDLAVEVMKSYHRAVAAGVDPARALAGTSAIDTRIPLVCFGAG
ncbi:hypothetical protein UK23_39265 [Lentzea aerocolonigenes]|uniref:CHAT domain-containing protein n=1 Tax=Lentzea aerocolonigenes TaxID=68170 RepID=A0A0F0GHM7_LENAE|nr:CHAT domain-containing protein [Lentzea aerocolonigenes]KJK42001.1 hypothetical protein UK23_39265 [Lentzea aerocolonigenes]